MNYIFGVFIILIILWIYILQYSQIKCDKIFLDDLFNYNLLKTGDMILFKGYNNFNSLYHGSYFGHVGVVYIMDSIPMLFESNGIEFTPLREHHSSTGVYLTPLKERIAKYKGKCYLKSLNKEVNSEYVYRFKDFIKYALENMYYDYSVIIAGIKKGLGIEKCNNATNCAETAFLSLITLGLLPENMYDQPLIHSLLYICNLYNLSNDFYYHKLIEIIDHPFAY